MEKTLRRLFTDTNHVETEALLFCALAWDSGWSQPVSKNGGANSWWAIDDKGRQVNIRYSHENHVIELWENGISGKKLATLASVHAVLRYFKVKP
jgi:hypothetical protein